MNGNVIGGDPGTQGGVAVIDKLGKVLFFKGFTPGMTLTQFRDICREAAAKAGPGARAWVEQVESRPGQGHVGPFSFGHALGWLEMGLAAHDVEVRHVRPMMWQATLGCLSSGNKNVTKRRAIDLFGVQVGEKAITHAVADALLLAEYGRGRAGVPG